MLAPLIDALGDRGLLPEASGRATQPSKADFEGIDLTPGQRAALHLANGASIKDLIAALLGRLEAQLAHLEQHASPERD